MANYNNPSGKDHPNYKHGKYVGAKKKKGTLVPRTGAAPQAREELFKRVEIGETFEPDSLWRHIRIKLNSIQKGQAMYNLVKQGFVAKVDENRRLSYVLYRRLK